MIQDIRTGLVFQLKDAVSPELIMNRDKAIIAKVLPRFKQIKNLCLLGNNTIPKIPIFSFVIKSKNGLLLHPDFVT